MKRVYNNLLQEEYFKEVLDNGLTVVLCKRPSIKNATAMLTVKYGSLHQEFKYDGCDDIIKTPAGVAHFLEHKMFEMPNDVDACDLFAELGADVNAYTTYECTSYYFSTVTNFNESLELLLDFVQTPYFIEESVEGEKKIIEQEILSSYDKPGSMAYVGILKTMFENNKVRDDIGGTVESLNQINSNTLNLCYNTFYHPANMYLVVVGDIDVDATISLIKANQSAKDFLPYLNPQVIMQPDTDIVYKKYDSYKMDVNVANVNIGLKLDLSNQSIYDILRLSILLDFALEEIFDYSSSTYQKWLRERIIDTSFSYNFSLGKYYSYVLLGGRAYDVDEFIRTIKNAILNIPSFEFSKDHYTTYIRSYKSYLIRKFNSVDSIANYINDTELDDIDIFTKLDILEKVKYEELEEIFKFIKEDSLAIYVVEPKNE